MEAVGGVYRIRLDSGAEIDAFLRGRLKKERRTDARIVPGDRVRIGIPDQEDASATVEAVLPRESELVRAGAGGRIPKPIAANVDRIVVTVSALEPPLEATVTDRFLVLAECSQIPPVLVINKVDLPGAREGAEEAGDLYRSVGYPVHQVSARTGEGTEALARELSRGISVLVGPSGVGKSSLLNALDPGLKLRTAPVTRRLGRGRHTTVSARLLPLIHGGWVVDTPGFSDVTLWEVERERLRESFPEFVEPAEGCRFRGCLHLHEPGCGVKAALEEGRISPGRYGSYRRLLEGG